MRVRDLNWMQLEAYLATDDRIILPVGSTEQHAYLSLETDNILAERASVEAAEPLGVPVLPVLPYGVTGFTAYPGSPTLLESTLVALLSDVVDLECPRFRGHLSAWSAQSDQARRMSAHAKGIELPEAVPARVSA